MLQSGVEDVLVLVAQALELLGVEQPVTVSARQLLDDGAGHAQVKPEAFAPGDVVFVNRRMDDARGRVDRGEPVPERLPVFGKRIVGGALVCEVGAAPVLGRPDDVVAGVRKRRRIEAAVVVPLRPHPGNTVARVVRKAEDVRIPAGRGRVHAVRAVQLPATPPGAGSQEIVDPERLIVLEDDESAARHFPLQGIQSVCGRWTFGGEVDPPNFDPDGVEGRYLRASPFDGPGAGLVERWEAAGMRWFRFCVLIHTG